MSAPARQRLMLPGHRGVRRQGRSVNGEPNPPRLVVKRKDVPAADTLPRGVRLAEVARASAERRPLRAEGEMGRREIRIVAPIHSSVAQGRKMIKVSA